jgi:hypothetical protein
VQASVVVLVQVLAVKLEQVLVQELVVVLAVKLERALEQALVVVWVQALVQELVVVWVLKKEKKNHLRTTIIFSRHNKSIQHSIP